MEEVEKISVEFIPETLEKVLDIKSVTQAKLSNLLGYQSENVVNKIIKHNRQATATDLLRMSALLGVSPETFSVAPENLSLET